MFWVTTVGVVIVCCGTGISAYMAFLTQQQVAATVGQLKATQDQVKLAQKQLEDSETDSVASERRQNETVASSKLVAEAAKAQAEATRASASAAVRAAQASIQAANAQRDMAETTAAAQRPVLIVSDLSITGFSEPPKDGAVPISIHYVIENDGPTRILVKRWRVGVVIGTNLPAVPDYKNSFVTYANDMEVVPHHRFFTTQNPSVLLQPEAAKSVAIGKSPMFVFGDADYSDATGVLHTYCWAKSIRVEGGVSTYTGDAGGAAYHCR